MSVWAAVVVTAAGCYLLKLAGTMLPDRLLAEPVVDRMATLVPVALLASIIAVQTVTAGHRLLVDARLAGLVFAATAVAARAPFLVVVVGAAATTAILRAL